jgi:NAD dependent epimerase/dehydratase
MELKNKKIIVTGADGFIGSHLTEALVRMGCAVRAFVYYNSFNSWGWLDHSAAEIRRSIEVVAGDIRDPHGVKAALHGCDVVFHLAALIGIPYSYYAPDNYLETNIRGTLNVVQAARELGIERVVHTSTSEVYGTARFVPITEDHPLQGQSPYAASKIAADHIALSFYRSFDTPVTVIRPFNTYGPRQSARAVIPTIVTQVLAGQTVCLGSRTPTRDLTYIRDTVDAFVRLAGCDQAVGQTFNIGSGFEISIGDLAEKIAALIGREITIVEDSQRVRPARSEVERLWADCSLAQQTFGWQPMVSLAEGLQKTIDWIAEHSTTYRTGAYVI